MQKFIFLFLVLTACGAQSNRLTSSEGVILSRIQQIRELRTAAAEWWPGFETPEYDTPLLYYTDSICYAVNPTQQFRDTFGAHLVYHDSEIEIYKTALPDTLPFHMETQLSFGDSTAYNGKIPFLCCSSPELTRKVVSDITNDTLWLPMVLHEYMHGFQFQQPGFAETFAKEITSIDESKLARLHKQYAWFHEAIKSENGTLLAALDAKSKADRDSCIGRFLVLRTDRKHRMAQELGDSTVRTEEIYELMEGDARFVEAQAGFRLECYTEADKWLYDTAHSGYFFATGYNLIRLLDSCGIDKSHLFTERLLPLETYFTNR